MRIITREEHLGKLRELFCPLEVKSQFYKAFETEGWTLNDILLTQNPDLSVTVTPYKIKKECYL